jgi:hypothetical protein
LRSLNSLINMITMLPSIGAEDLSSAQVRHPSLALGEGHDPIVVVMLKQGEPLRAYGTEKVHLYVMDVDPRDDNPNVREIDLGMEDGPYWGTLRRMDVERGEPARAYRTHYFWQRSA